MKKRVLLQVQALTYLYMGLGAIYTKYKDFPGELEVDVLFTGDLDADNFIRKIKLSKYINSVYCINRNSDLRKISKRIEKLKNNFLNRFLYKKFYGPIAKEIINYKIPNLNYDDVFFSHESHLLIISLLRTINEKINFVMYGDGSGLLMRKDSKLVNPFVKIIKNPVLNEIVVDEIIALAPMIEDGICDFDNIPVTATEPAILSDLIENDSNAQEIINNWTDVILEKYSNFNHKILLLTTRLDDKRFNMSEEDQVSIYIDMVNEYCPENSLVILKLHPSSTVDVAKILQEKRIKNCVFETVPITLKEYPVEIYSKLMKNLDLAITFLSSSRISLSLLYNMETIDSSEVIKNYPLKDRVNCFLEVYAKVLELYPTWNKKSILCKYDLVPMLIDFYKNHNSGK